MPGRRATRGRMRPAASDSPASSNRTTTTGDIRSASRRRIDRARLTGPRRSPAGSARVRRRRAGSRPPRAGRPAGWSRRPGTGARRAGAGRGRARSPRSTSSVRMDRPAPSSTTRRATIGWSAPCGTTSIGTPAYMASLTLFIPPWVTNSAARASTSSCGTERRTSTLAGSGPSAAGSVCPVETTTVPPSGASAVAKVRSSCGSALNTVPSETYSTGSCSRSTGNDGSAGRAPMLGPTNR